VLISEYFQTIESKIADCIHIIETSLLKDKRSLHIGIIEGEAMAHGCVCISSNNPCLPEIFGSAALYYPPKDFTTLAKQIQVVLSMEQTERAKMSSTAKDTALKFSWEICAQKTVDELQKALQ